MGNTVPRETLPYHERYALYDPIASGGMATVHFGRLLGAAGFARTVAIKRLHPQMAHDPDFVAMFVDEARLAARIRHPNVVATLDVVSVQGELFLVMEYLPGESLLNLLRVAKKEGKTLPPDIAVAVATGMLYGLHAAHEAKSERGEPLDIVHRDVSPSNVLVGVDGVARVLDFGIAKASVSVHNTNKGVLRGKLRYMCPERFLDHPISRLADIYASGVTLWEMLTCERLFDGESEGAIITQILEGVVPPPSMLVPGLPPALDAIALKALARRRHDRFATARDMAVALEAALTPASPRAVGEWVEAFAGPSLEDRAERVARIESAVDGAPERAAAQPTSLSENGVTVTVTPHAFAAIMSEVQAAADEAELPTIALAASNMPTMHVVEVSPEEPIEEATMMMPTRLQIREPPEPEPTWPSRVVLQRTSKAAAAGLTAALVVIVGVMVAGPAPEPSTLASPVDDAARRFETPRPVETAAPGAPASSAAEVVIDLDEEQTAPRGQSPPASRPAAPPFPAAPKGKPSCNPPWVLDASGRRRVKRECL